MNPSPAARVAKRCRECGASVDSEASCGFCPSCALEGALGLGSFQPSDEDIAGPLQPLQPAFQTIFGDYELLEEIARGGMGIVYKARQPSIDRIVAVKMILFGSLANAEQVRRFRIEATAAGSLQHPNIVAVHEVGLHEGQNFMVMDYVDGPNLSRLVQDQPLPARKVAHYLKAIAEAVQFAHDRGILHRDLKPSNVIIGSDDRPRVTDFGLARYFNAESSLTLSGHALGSPNYMPPEQSGGGRQKVGRTSDVYSLGAILYHLLTARPPFRAETVHETLQQVQGSEPLAPRLLNQSVPRDLETICLKCLEKEPAKRYATAQELADELDRFLKDEPITARPVTRIERAWCWCRRKPVVASLTAGCALLLLAVAIGAPIAAFRINQERLRTRQNLYSSDIRLASQAVHEGAFNHARGLLTNYLPQRGAVDLRGFEWRYLWQAVRESEPFRAFEGLPAPSAWDETLLFRSERYLYNQSLGQLKAWDMTTWEPVPIIPPPQPPSVQWQWDPGRESAYAVDQPQHTLAVYTLPRFDPVATLSLPGPISLVAMSHDRQVLAVGFGEGASYRVLVWDLAHGASIGALGNFEAELSALTVSRDGRLLAASSANGVAGIWDLKTLQPLPAPPSSPSHRRGLEFTPDNKRLLSGVYANLSVWDIEARKTLDLERAGQLGPHHFGFTPDAKYLVVGGDGYELALLDSRTLLAVGTMRGHRGFILGIAFSLDGKLMASSSADQTVRIWDMATQTEVGIVGGFGERISRVEFSADGQNIVMIGGFGQLRVHQLSAVLQRGLFAKIPEPNGITHLALSPDERHLATMSVGGTLALWDRQSRSLIRTNRFPRRDEDNFGRLAFSPDGERLAWVTGDALRIMRGESGEISTTPIDGNHEINSVAFSADGRELAYGCGKQLIIYEVGSGRQQRFAATDGDVYAVKYSPDGALIAFGDEKGTVTLCQRASGKVLSRERKAHSPSVSDVEMSPDGRLLATCGTDALIKLWRVQPDGLHIQDTLRGHVGYLSSLAFSPDGARLASASGDQTLKIWDTHRGAELATLFGHHHLVASVEFTKDDRTIYSAGFDGEIRFWDAPPLAEIDLSTKSSPVRTAPTRSTKLK